MPTAHKHQTLEKSLLLLQTKLVDESISIGTILEILSGKGRSIILIMLSLPFCQPIQIPGLSTPFGLVIAFVGLRIAFGKNIWLPKQFLVKKIKSYTLKKTINNSLSLINKVRRWIRPRMVWASSSLFMQILNGLSIFALGIFLALPLPIPFTNLTAAWALFLIALGMLEDDGLFVLLGYFIFFLTVAFFISTLLPLVS